MIRRLLLALVASLLPGAVALGAEAPASEPATLQFFNREIATFRVPAFGYSPSERVFGARARIEAAVRQEGAGEVKLRTAPEGRFVEIDGKVAFVILAGDADGTVGQTAEEAAEAVRVRLQQAVTAARESATPAALAWSLGLTGLATGLWVLLIRVLAKSNRRIGLRLSAVAADQVEKLKVSGITLLRGLYVRSAVRRIVTGVLWAVALFGTYVWLTFVLGRFAWTHPWGSRLSAYLLGVLADAGSAILHAVPGLVTVAVIVVITRWVNAVIGGFFDRVASGEIAIGWLDAEIANPTRRVVTFVVWLFALAMAYPYLPGAQTEAFKGLSVLVGLMVSIGASGLVGQAASGLILMYSRTLRAGEFVRIADTEGTVTELGLFATRLRSGLGEEIVLPNALVLSNTTRNFSRVVVLRGVPAGGVRGPGGAAPACRGDEPAVREDPGCVQRAWSADHVASLSQ